VTRRDLAWLLPLLSPLPAAGADMAPRDSQVFRFADLPAHTNAEGNVTRPVLRGELPTGEYIEVHETALAAGKMPHAPHRHKHTELMLIRTGELELILDGKTEPLTAGDIAWCASEQLHGLKNTGTEPANYFVIAIGRDLRPAAHK
jgi:quercetin dioxygenase-like cupin family protein